MLIQIPGVNHIKVSAEKKQLQWFRDMIGDANEMRNFSMKIQNIQDAGRCNSVSGSPKV